MVIIRICQRCGNRLQPDRARIKGKHFARSPGVCDICHSTSDLFDPDNFGLPIMNAPSVGAQSTQARSSYGRV